MCVQHLSWSGILLLCPAMGITTEWIPECPAAIHRRCIRFYTYPMHFQCNDARLIYANPSPLRTLRFYLLFECYSYKDTFELIFMNFHSFEFEMQIDGILSKMVDTKISSTFVYQFPPKLGGINAVPYRDTFEPSFINLSL